MNKDVTLRDLNPKRVFAFFEKLTQIPRGSGHEKQISDYLVDFAKQRGLSVEQDKYYNVIIRKAASKGCDGAPVTMLQNHMDMVCEKLPTVSFDFLTDAIVPVVDIEKGIVRAAGTSLGADNGIGLAVALAILDDDSLRHPPLEVVCTVGEEIGLVGASEMDMSGLRSEYMISSDGFELDNVQAGCAGSGYFVAQADAEWVDVQGAFPYDCAARITVTGLIGGHSGIDICKQRANANKLVGRLLRNVRAQGIDIAISGYTCRNSDNSIAREASCDIVLGSSQLKALESTAQQVEAALSRELALTDPDIRILLQKMPMPQKYLSRTSTDVFIDYLVLVPDGVFLREHEFTHGTMAACSANIGRAILTDETIQIRSMIRSNFDDLLRETFRSFALLAGRLGMQSREERVIPVWEYRADSVLLGILKDSYRELFHTEIGVAMSHGTSEGGLFRSAVGCDVVCLGADIRGNHSPYEIVTIESVGRLYELNVRILEKLAGMTGNAV